MESQDSSWKLEVLSALIIISLLAYLAPYAMSETGEAANFRNVTVTTQVNITNSFPEVVSIKINPDPLTLNAGDEQNLTINVTVRDFDGFSDIALVNVTFFDNNTVTSQSPDDNNTHYTNTSCTVVPGEQSGFYANYTCNLSILYYANNGTNWVANVTAQDNQSFNDSLTNTSTINGLLALNVTDVIDYGNLAVGETNDPSVEANVTNFGNLLINVSVYAYGNVTGDGLAMVCEQRNISVDNQRFDTNATETFSAMTPTAATPTIIPGFQLPQRTDDSVGGEVINGTYWRLNVPTSTNPGGRCNGTVVFQAENP